MLRVLPPIACIVCLSACTVGPDYVKRDPPSPATFLNALPGLSERTTAADAFWASFSDPDLAELVDKALHANHDIRIAVANLREVRGLRNEVRGGLFPRADANVNAVRERLSLAQLPGTSTHDRTNADLDVEIDAAWEADLFGGIRRNVESASAQTDASRADLAAVKLSVSAMTATTYFDLRGQQRRLRVARDNLKNQLDTLGIIRTRFNAGRGTDFDVSRARGLAESTRARIPALEADIARTTYALAVLTGDQPGALSDRLGREPKPPGKLPIFVADDPKALLRCRPDVVAAERRVAAATASIGVSTAELFPSVTLIGSVGLEAGLTKDLAHGNAVKYIGGPSLTWNILDFGRIRSRIEQADARYDRALASYEQVVLTALQEAESALVTVDRVEAQSDALAASTDAARNAAHLAQLRFEAGATDLLDLLDAQRQVLDAEDHYAEVETARAMASINLYKAMGGWQSDGNGALPIASKTSD